MLKTKKPLAGKKLPRKAEGGEKGVAKKECGSLIRKDAVAVASKQSVESHPGG